MQAVLITGGGARNRRDAALYFTERGYHVVAGMPAVSVRAGPDNEKCRAEHGNGGIPALSGIPA